MRTNVATAKAVIRHMFAEMAERCADEQARFESRGDRAPQQKRNEWALYLDGERVRRCEAGLLGFVARHPECRSAPLPPAHLRSLLMFQHAVTEDTWDVCCPERERRHCDTFEGHLTHDGINSQLIKDAHRSEWSVEGRPFTVPAEDRSGVAGAGARTGASEERQLVMAAFRDGLVEALEEFLVEFCKRQELSAQGTRQMMQAVTTQMSQCGLANLERCSQASNIFVSGEGLEQRTAYNLSTMRTALDEALKLSIYCLKTGFSTYHTAESLARAADSHDDEDAGGPLFCSPSSYLYQYATLRFSAVRGAQGPDGVECVVLDLLDEVVIDPVAPL